jgi:hypothetical protein
MKTIEVDERTRAGKMLIETARMMAVKYKGIILQEEDDPIMLAKMLVARKSGIISRTEVLGTLDKIIAKK